MNFKRTLFYVVELLVLTLVFFANYYLMMHFHQLYTLDLFKSRIVLEVPRAFPLYLKAYWAAIAVWAVVLRLRSPYGQFRVQTNFMIFRHVVFEGILFTISFACVAFLFKFDFLSRLFIFLYAATSVLALTLDRIAGLSFARYLRKKGINAKNILIVGTGPRAQQFMSRIAKHREWGYRLVGLLDPDPMLIGEDVATHRVLGVLEDLPDILSKNVIDEVFFLVPRKWLDKIQNCILYCEAVGVPATVSTDLFEAEIARKRVPKSLDGLSFLTFQTPLVKGEELMIKRICDILFASVILFLTSPVLLIVAIAVKATSKGPILFKQVRSGLNGRQFKILKFRSMVIDAEKQLAALKSLNQMSGPVFKIHNDPRITSIGRFLRATSLDEFPQFINVLMGDMSVVGPRPPLPNEVEEYAPWQRRRLSMKPGITCIWQVSGRNAIDFERWMELDLKYIDNWSLGLDVRLLAKTVKVVVARDGK
ncbi:MAG: sugar transferase [Candidatus Omnitrophota bacterium]